MIVRIMTEDQYRLTDDHAAELQRLDDTLDHAMESGDTAGFDRALHQIVNFVRQNGQRVSVDEVVPSDAIIPAPDMSLHEAKSRLHTIEAKQQAGE